MNRREPPSRDEAPLTLNPIGVFYCAARYRYDAARQPAQSQGGGGVIQLHAHRELDVAARDLAGFSRIWLLYHFHQNANWKPVVLPPRGERKVGALASRAPYRPNPIGLSCVELLRVEGLRIEVGPHDLLDGTPILDIKPYLPYADSFPDAATGWLDAVDADLWEVSFLPEAAQRLAWIEERAGNAFPAFLSQQLSEMPMDTRRKRIRPLGDGQWEIAYRTWRARYGVDGTARQVSIVGVSSGYGAADLAERADPHQDKEIHRAFHAEFERAVI